MLGIKKSIAMLLSILLLLATSVFVQVEGAEDKAQGDGESPAEVCSHNIEVCIIPVSKYGGDESNQQLQWSIGEEVFFMVTVKNTVLPEGIIDVMVEVDDASPSTSKKIEDMAPGDTEVLYFTKTYSISDGPGLKHTNAHATVTAHECCEADTCFKTVTSNPGAWLFIEPQPKLSVTKTSSQSTWDLFDDVSFGVTITNEGDVPLTNIAIIDENLDYTKTFDDVLDPGDSKDYIIEETYFAETPGEWINTVIVEAWYIPDNPDKKTEAIEFDGDCDLKEEKVTAENSITIDVNAPDISLIKEANDDAFYEGDTVTYQFTIENTGDMPLKDILLYDSLLLDEPIALGNLDVDDEPLTHTIDFTVPPEGSIRTILNEAYVTSFKSVRDDGLIYDDDYDCLAAAEAEDTIVAVPAPEPPEISLLKEAVDEITIGESITYTFTVTNTGTVPVELYELEDSVLPDSPFELAIILEPGTAHSFSATLPADKVQAAMGDDYYVHNQATVYGGSYNSDQQAPEGVELPTQLVEATDSEDVYVIYPKISVDKSADQSAYTVNDPVVYTITIKNDGNVDFYEVWLYDEDDAGNLFYFDELSDVSTYGPGLAAGETAVLTIETSYESPYDDLTNEVIAEGYFGDDDVIEATDKAVIDVWFYNHPEITINKEADKDTLVQNQEVTYTFTVKNTGNVDLTDIVISDELLNTSTVVFTHEFTDLILEPDEQTTATFTTSYDADGSYTNEATASAWYYADNSHYGLTSELTEPVDEDTQVYSDPKAQETVVVDTPYTPSSSSSSRKSKKYDLVVTQTGDGTVNTGTFRDLTGTYNMGEIIPADGWQLEGFFGENGEDVSGPDASGNYAIQMNEDKAVEVVFTEAEPPQAVPVELTVVVTGEGNITSHIVTYPSSGDLCTFGPLIGINGYEFVSIGGPDFEDLIMVDPSTYNLIMNEDKEVHILFQKQPSVDVTYEEAILDADIPLADPISTTGGIPLTAFFAAGFISVIVGLRLKNAKK